MTPRLVGLINAIIPGLGYVIIKRRQTFGWLLLTSLFAGAIASFGSPVTDSLFLANTTYGKVFEAIGIVCAMLAFGIDGYKEATNKSN